MMPARHVALGVARLLGGQRHALDGQEEPDAVDEARPGRRRTPNGMKLLAPAASVGAMSRRLPGSNCGTMPITNASSATTAIAVMTNISFSASPTP